MLCVDVPKLFSYQDEFGERTGLHFVHYATAVDLDCNFGYSEFCRYLFIEHSRNHKFHYLFLAVCQVVVALFESSDLSMFSPPDRIAGQSLFYRIQQILIPERLCEEFQGARFYGFD